MKRTLNKFIATACFTFSIALFCTMTVSAYIDPATTAMVTQIVVGVFIALGVSIGIYRRKILMFFKSQSVKRTQRKIEKDAKNN